jgi:Protein of unknown function (DUF3667).
MLDQAFEAVTNIDGRLLRSLLWLLTRPGQLTLAFLQGRRKLFLAPVPLFLVTNVLFFTVDSMSGGMVFSTPLESHLRTQPWSDAMRPLITRRLEAMHTTAAAYAPQFDAEIGLHARSLIMLQAVSFTVLLAAVCRGSRRPFAAHAVFSLHLYAFTLLILSAGTLVPAAPRLWGGIRSQSDGLDHVLSVTLVGACAVYLWVAVGAVYGERGASLVVKCALLTAGATAIFLGYRFVLLLITLYTT